MTMRNIVAVGSSFVTGLLIAVMIHFMLYRISLPLKPFIYVAF
jgi:hypothetical protein